VKASGLQASSALAVYAWDPANFALTGLSVLDDFVLVPLVLHALLRFVPLDIRASFLRRSLPR
jgi:hypothetical protein